MDKSTGQEIPYSQFTCIGTGFSGIGFGATLKRWYNISDVQFFEREAEIGGTWLLNNYPGAASDIPNLLYCYSYEPNPNWDQVLPGRDELLTYLRSVAHKYNVPSRTRFRSQVLKCEWIEDRKRWRIHVKDLTTSTAFLHESQFLFTAAGVLDQPRQPDIPGLANFKGPVFHTARWRHDIDLSDKNVVVFGNGCTGAQVVPALAPDVKFLTQFVRSKHWIVPSLKGETVRPLQLLLRYVPGARLFVRYILYSGAENDFVGINLNEKGAKYRKSRSEFLTNYMKRKAPEKYHDMLVPEFEYGCKRRVFDAGYLSCLHRDNVEVTNATPKEVTESHILTTDGGKVDADVIILANGFKTDRCLNGIEVIGRDQTLDEHWDNLGGPGAYQTCAMSGFPNFFMIMGPNSATSHTSAIMISENVVNLALRQIKPVLDGTASSVEISASAEQAHVEQLQRDLENRVWSTGCNGWYVQTDKAGKFAWNCVLYPYSQAQFWYACLFPDKKAWVYTDYRRPWGSVLRKLFLLSIVACAIGVFANGGRKGPVQNYLFGTLKTH